MKPETYVEALRAQPELPLRAALLYGSAAAGDHAGRASDVNLLLVLDRLGKPELDQLRPPSRAWLRAGNPAPLLFTPERLRQSADVFPIELLDMKETHRVLFGEDVLEDLEVRTDNLRLQIEHELKGKLIHLQKAYLATGGHDRKVAALMASSFTSITVLFRAALRLFRDTVPAVKLEAVRALSEHITFDVDVFTQVRALKERRAATGGAVGDLFARYLAAVEQVADAVDAHLHKAPAAARES